MVAPPGVPPPGAGPLPQMALAARLTPYADQQPAWYSRQEDDGTPLPREDGAFSLGAYFWLASLLILACLLPRVPAGPPGRETTIHFVDFEVMLDAHESLAARLESAYPLLAAILVIAVAALLPGVARSLALLIVAGSYLALIVADASLRQTASAFLRSVFDPAIAAFVGVTASWIGLSGLFVGSRVRYARPGSSISGSIGAIGATAYLAGLIIPRSQGWMPGFSAMFTYWTGDSLLERIPLFVPILVLGNGEAPWQYRLAALAALLGVVCLLIAGILCLWNVRPRAGSAARAHMAFWMWVAHLGTACAGSAIIILAIMRKVGISELPEAYIYAPTFDIPLMFLKDLCFRYAMLLLILMGGADLVVTLWDRSAERRRAAYLGASL